jgi:hypothetical protein
VIARRAPRYPLKARLLAGSIALLSWLALAWAVHHWAGKAGGWWAALVQASTFYTNWTGLAVAAVFTGIALGARPLGRPAVIGNILVYRDQHHITTAYSRLLAPLLAARLS